MEPSGGFKISILEEWGFKGPGENKRVMVKRKSLGIESSDPRGLSRLPLRSPGRASFVWLCQQVVLRVREGMTGLRKQSRTGESQLPGPLSGPNLSCEWERDRMKADHGSGPGRVQDVSPPSELPGEEGEGIRFLGGVRGAEEGSGAARPDSTSPSRSFQIPV